MMKVLHWGLNAALAAAGVTCVVLAFKVQGVGNAIGCGATGLAFLAGAAVFSVYTWKRG